MTQINNTVVEELDRSGLTLKSFLGRIEALLCDDENQYLFVRNQNLNSPKESYAVKIGDEIYEYACKLSKPHEVGPNYSHLRSLACMA